jgi:hypothetical protein
MKIIITTILLLSSQLSLSNCMGENLEITDIQRFFKPGSLKSEYFTTIEVSKKSRRCNTFSGCEEWSSPKATLSLGEIVSSIDTEMDYKYYPLRGEVYFSVSEVGELSLMIDFYSLDMSAKVDFQLESGQISLPSNGYFRPTGAWRQPTAYASYQNENKRYPFDLKGSLKKNCMLLKSNFTQNKHGILYDEFEITFAGEIN